MTNGKLAEQEFVAHLFAPLDGPNTDLARSQVNALWEACRSQLGTTDPIVGAGLSGRLPDDPAGEREGALAGLQDHAVNFQVIARREHDVLNISLAMAAPDAPPRGRRRIGALPPPGWYEFARWWRALTPAGVGALLGDAVIYLAKHPRVGDDTVRDALPRQDDDAADWWTRRHVVEGFPLWEVTPGGDHPHRRLVVVARRDDDARLSRFTWSDGGVALPPLGRYLMHAAKLRYLARVRGDGRDLDRVSSRATDRLDRLTRDLDEPGAGRPDTAERAALAADEAAVAGTLAALRVMRTSAGIARENMVAALADPLPADARIAGWLTGQLAHDIETMAATRDRAARVRDIVGGLPTVPSRSELPPGPPPAPAPPRDDRVDHRIALGVDVVRYSGRSVPGQHEIQERLAGMVTQVLERIEVSWHDTDHQEAGDEVKLVLPPDCELHRVLPKLLHGWRATVVDDNGKHPEDRIRLRLAVAAGPLARSAIGLTGEAIIEVGRLLDSSTLRQAANEHPDADLVALISSRVYEDVVGSGYRGLDPGQFVERAVENKEFRKTAWLWFGAPAT